MELERDGVSLLCWKESGQRNDPEQNNSGHLPQRFHVLRVLRWLWLFVLETS